MKCYRDGGCGPYEMYSCADCPASKPEYAARGKKVLTNADRIRSMTDEELAEFLEYLYSHCDGPWEILFERKFCDHCPAPEYELEDGRNLKLHERDFTGGKCPHGSDVLWWLKQTYKEDA